MHKKMIINFHKIQGAKFRKNIVFYSCLSIEQTNKKQT